MKPIIASSFHLVAIAFAQRPEYSGSRHLWYQTPGTDFNSGLAVGNGRLGALVYGSATERIVLNENSVWSGPFVDRINPNALRTFHEVRQLLQDGDFIEAGRWTLASMSGNPNVSRTYSVTDDLVLDFGHKAEGISYYERWLDTHEGITGVIYDYENTTYT